jgi:acetyl-CoA carboxylase biotin carboxyl carrier protein
LKRGFSGSSTVALPAASQLSVATDLTPQAAVAETVITSLEGAEDSKDSTLHIITSPIVGTFYRAPSPGAEPYVKLGDQIEEGTILCLVEAMKLMNEIPSDANGEVAQIYVENGRPVEFGQKLFGIRPRKQG